MSFFVFQFGKNSNILVSKKKNSFASKTANKAIFRRKSATLLVLLLIMTLPYTFNLVIGPPKAVHEIAAGHRSLSGTISYVTDRIRFLTVTMAGSIFKFQQFIIFRRPARIASDRHKVPTAGHDARYWRNIYFRRCKNMIRIVVSHCKDQTDAISKIYLGSQIYITGSLVMAVCGLSVHSLSFGWFICQSIHL